MFKRLTVAALAITGLAAVPATAEVIAVDEGGFVTQDSAVVEAEPQKVWLELISPSGWWNDAHTWSGDAANMSITPQGGGCFCERIPAQEDDGAVGLDGSVQHMVVLQANPRNVLRMRGALGPLQSEPVDGVLTITLKPMEKGTRILWEYVVGGYMRYPVEAISKAVDGVMSQQLDGLASKLGRIEDPEAKAPTKAPAKPAEASEEPAAPAADKTTEEPAAKKPAAPARPASMPEAKDPPRIESAIGEDFLKDAGEKATAPVPPKAKPAAKDD